jgi:hypothetical protein
MTSFQFLSITPILRLFRASFIVIALGLTMAVANVCPTGQTDCDMADMTETTQPADICVMACGVLLPVDVVVAHHFLGSVSTLRLPDASTGVSFLPEPAFRPPRFLA